VVSFSYSSIKTFEQCPKKYYHLKVVQDVKDAPGEAAVYGVDFHKAAEDYIKLGTELPKKYAYALPTLSALNAIPGVKHCEIKLGVKKTEGEYEPCGFFDKDMWWRGIADLVILNGDKAFVADYKTSKNAKYADTRQLDLLAGAVFLHYPEVKKIKSALLYVVSHDLIDKKHEDKKKETYLGVFNKELDRLEGAMLSGVWNAKASGLCGWCPVESCEHWRDRR